MEISMDTDQTGVVVVDVQGDFTLVKSGTLAVQGTDQSYLDKVLAATRQLKRQGYKIFATQDFHPPGHVSFYTSHKAMAVYDTIEIDGRTQILWPPHCVQGTRNAEILIEMDLFSGIIQKGTDPKYDSYSGFFDDGGVKTDLKARLLSHHLKTLVVFGLATDYCVRATAMDAVKEGFKVILIADLCRGVAEETTRSALTEMNEAGIKIAFSLSDLL